MANLIIPGQHKRPVEETPTVNFEMNRRAFFKLDFGAAVAAALAPFIPKLAALAQSPVMTQNGPLSLRFYDKPFVENLKKQTSFNAKC